jgi:hypothetical protein
MKLRIPIGGAELGRKNHSLIPAIRSGGGWNHLMSELTPEAD